MKADLLPQDEGELLIDESFINYCLQRNKKDVAHWESYINANPDKNEHLQELKAFVLSTAQHSKKIEWEQQWKAFKKKVEIQQPARQNTTKPTYRTLYKWMAAAAIISVVVAGIIWYMSSKVETIVPSQIAGIVYTSARGQKKTLKLADGSTVILNSDSRLTLSAGFNKTNRTVSLDGEAYFDVVHDGKNQFIVKTQHAEIKDIGTVFNVRNYLKDGIMEAALIKGKIEIMLNDQAHKKITLEPSQKFVIKNDNLTGDVINKSFGKQAEPGISIQPVTIKDSLITEISWLDNKLFFVNKPLREIANDLERNFDVRFVFKTPEVMNYRYTGLFENQSLEEIMKILKLSKNINYQIKDKELVIE